MAQRTIPDVATLGEAGDLSAPPGSRPWAIAVRLEIEACLHNAQASAARLAWLTQTMEEHAGYTQLSDEHGHAFTTYRAFCEAKPPWGLGYSTDVIERIINERKTAQQYAEQPKMLLDDTGPATDEERAIGYVLTNRVEQRGESADYLTARIARDRPDILERMKAGDYKSVRAAALEAGIVKPRVSAQTNPESVARVVIRNFTPDQIADLIERLVPYLPIEST